jgi:hypothetical protein
MARSKTKLSQLIGSIDTIDVIIHDKLKPQDRAGDVVVTLHIGGKQYEVLRLTESCDYFHGQITRHGLNSRITRSNARKIEPFSRRP